MASLTPMRDTIEDVTKTLLPGGVIFGVVTTADLKADLEIALLILSITYTLIRLVMLIRHRGWDREDDTGEADPPDYLNPP